MKRQSPPLSRLEAHSIGAELHGAFKKGAEASEEIATLVGQLQHGQAWKVMGPEDGYPDWASCFRSEFGLAYTTYYRRLKAAEVRAGLGILLQIANGGGHIPDSHCRALARVPPKVRRKVVRRAYRAAGRRPTARDMERMTREVWNGLSPEARLELAQQRNRTLERRDDVRTRRDGVERCTERARGKLSQVRTLIGRMIEQGQFLNVRATRTLASLDNDIERLHRLIDAKITTVEEMLIENEEVA